MVLTVILSALAASGHVSVITNGVNVMLAPFSEGFGSVGLAIKGYKQYFDSVDALRAENEALKNEVNDLKGLIYDAEAMKKENEFYKNFLGIKEEHSDYIFLDATVINREAGNYVSVFSLNKGTRDGIEKNIFFDKEFDNIIFSKNGKLCIFKDGVVSEISEAQVDLLNLVVLDMRELAAEQN